jgi:hypothetical protein
MLVRQAQPPGDLIIDAGALPCTLLPWQRQYNAQFRAAWALTNNVTSRTRL